ncbi:peptidoglycan DD-metalloendopeptidase family protein [Hephaestia sp. GCM10023244]|uniref:M23 family metallopeptidase n=1 Tax=unclassified Hephaestia TaxID=2631281 RepID=UPI0020775EC1|nr:M23 family metallopeptidase [Hephaestia sp. MAHUQ-44]MCM8730147.1 M23 family metallopeptidase [Hephaestia sp. MAHUQ-44]
MRIAGHRRTTGGLAALGAMAALAGCIPAAAPPVAPAPPPQQDRGYPDYRPDYRQDVTTSPARPPAWETNPVAPNARTIATRSYTVEPGDTLRGIAIKTGGGELAIAQANGLAEPYVIRAGQRLTIPGGRYHEITRGQTGIAIARAYGVEWSRIVAANGLTEPYLLRTGWRLLIPGGDMPGQSSAAERAAAFTLDIDDLVTGSEPAIAENRAPAAAATSPAHVPAPTTAVAAPTRLVGGFSWPVQGRVVSKFGSMGSGKRNDGIQIATPVGTPIAAAADGVVAYAGTGIPSLGGLVILKHGDGWVTVYGNASSLLVTRGQSIKRGQRIALSGQSGSAPEPGVHFEVRKGRDAVDPLGKLPG